MAEIIIPKGTILYRCAPTIELKRRRCYDTGKYFSNYILQALAMSIEYTKDLKLGIYKITDNITVQVTNHFDNKMLPIIIENKIKFLEKDKGGSFHWKR